MFRIFTTRLKLIFFLFFSSLIQQGGSNQACLIFHLIRLLRHLNVLVRSVQTAVIIIHFNQWFVPLTLPGIIKSFLRSKILCKSSMPRIIKNHRAHEENHFYQTNKRIVAYFCPSAVS